MSDKLKLAIGSLLLGLVVLALKLLAWALTGSVALLSDALESTVNLATALAALIAIRVAAMPADTNHPFGHHKAEYFSAVLEGVLIIVAALLILREAWAGFWAPRPLDAPLLGLAINAGATALNAAWAFVLVRQGRRLRSPALVADGKHLWADVVTSGGVALGVLLALVTGWWVLDPVMAALVAVNILWSGYSVVMASLSGLMDEAVPEDVQEKIRTVISAQATGAVEAHDLKTRHAGSATFVEFHLVVPGEMSVFDAHEICDRVEREMARAVPDVHTTIHVEPDHKSKDSGVIPVDEG
ncbi:cation diffusion facilitator family transporter [Sagittula stellata]|uniref:Protein p34 n=1 Tax=Sagittula stellata (strain ATCC 700073 / DSM 11524 / E-37) TaxID=388399 RepID=A3K9T2_SAGS3|nr:cation diffusion facilitator family transporter [Sagittula stellata]EBA06035.1 cation efflux transporter, CDF family protein [Sagittula stellata E-37]